MYESLASVPYSQSTTNKIFVRGHACWAPHILTADENIEKNRSGHCVLGVGPTTVSSSEARWGVRKCSWIHVCLCRLRVWNVFRAAWQGGGRGRRKERTHFSHHRQEITLSTTPDKKIHGWLTAMVVDWLWWKCWIHMQIGGWIYFMFAKSSRFSKKQAIQGFSLGLSDPCWSNKRWLIY